MTALGLVTGVFLILIFFFGVLWVITGLLVFSKLESRGIYIHELKEDEIREVDRRKQIMIDKLKKLGQPLESGKDKVQETLRIADLYSSAYGLLELIQQKFRLVPHPLLGTATWNKEREDFFFFFEFIRDLVSANGKISTSGIGYKFLERLPEERILDCQRSIEGLADAIKMQYYETENLVDLCDLLIQMMLEVQQEYDGLFIVNLSDKNETADLVALLNFFEPQKIAVSKHFIVKFSELVSKFQQRRNHGCEAEDRMTRFVFNVFVYVRRNLLRIPIYSSKKSFYKMNRTLYHSYCSLWTILNQCAASKMERPANLRMCLAIGSFLRDIFIASQRNEVAQFNDRLKYWILSVLQRIKGHLLDSNNSPILRFLNFRKDRRSSASAYLYEVLANEMMGMPHPNAEIARTPDLDISNILWLLTRICGLIVAWEGLRARDKAQAKRFRRCDSRKLFG